MRQTCSKIPLILVTGNDNVFQLLWDLVPQTPYRLCPWTPLGVFCPSDPFACAKHPCTLDRDETYTQYAVGQ